MIIDIIWPVVLIYLSLALRAFPLHQPGGLYSLEPGTLIGFNGKVLFALYQHLKLHQVHIYAHICAWV